MSENQENDTHSIALIYEDTHRSISQLISRIDSLNSRLTLILGFEAAFVKLAADLPDQLDIVRGQNTLFSQGCNSCLILKLSTFAALLIAICFALVGIHPLAGRVFLDPIAQLNDSAADTKTFQKKVIRLLAENSIPDLEKVLKTKSRNLRRSIYALGIASVASAINLIISTIFVSH